MTAHNSPYQKTLGLTMNRLCNLLILLALIPRITFGADWYARPYNGPTGYGISDGASYENAFNGIDSVRSIKWAGINPGDTLFVCGFHDGGGYDYASAPRPVMFIGNVHGTEAAPITISGGCPGDPGTIFGSGGKYVDGWALHNAANNIYSHPFTVFPSNLATLVQAFERHNSADLVDGLVRLNKPNTMNLQSWLPGSYREHGGVIYYKPTISTANDYVFYLGYLYPNINLVHCR